MLSSRSRIPVQCHDIYHRIFFNVHFIHSGILPVNAQAEANILILNYIYSFIFYSFNNRLSNNINCNF